MRRPALPALALAALALAGPGALRAADGPGVLVRVDPAAGRTGPAEVASALGAVAAEPLAAGWMRFRLPAAAGLARARDDLRASDADLALAPDAVLRPLAADWEVSDGVPRWSLDTWGSPATAHAGTGWIDVRAALAALPPVTVAVVDTGARVTHQDLDGVLAPGAGYDTYAETPALTDTHGHGTHVAGIVAGEAGNGVASAGVAPNARLLVLRAGPATFAISDLVQALTWAADHGARVVNLSLGGPGSIATYAPLCDAIQAVTERGLLVVAAAGNDGADNDAAPHFPANCPAPGLVSVAATQASGDAAGQALWPSSDTGATMVDLAAPGAAIVSSAFGSDTAAASMSGTSMAAPHVSAAAAVALGMSPGLTPVQVKARLMWSGRPLGVLAGHTVSGRTLDLAGLVALLGAPPADATAPGAPSITAITPEVAPGLVATATPRVDLTEAVDQGTGVSGYRLVVDGVAQAAAGPAERLWLVPSPIPDGTHEVRVRAADGDGNVADSAPRTLQVDTTPPQVGGPAAPADGARLATASVRLTRGDVTDAVSGLAGVRAEVDGQDAGAVPAGDEGLVVQVAGDGWHAWRLRAVDRAGNASDGAPRAFLVDRVAPTAPDPRSPADGALVGGAPELVWAGSDDAYGIEGYRVVVDGAAHDAAAGAVGVSASGLADGWHTWRVVARDSAGNETAGPARAFLLDATPPAVPAPAAPAAWVTDPAAVTPPAATDGAGVARSRWVVDGVPGAWRAGPAPAALAEVADGPHRVAAEACDPAGNCGGSPALAVGIDTVPPVIRRVALEGPAAAPLLVVDATDASSGVARRLVRVDGGPEAEAGPGWGPGRLASGTHHVAVRVVDAAGLSSTLTLAHAVPAAESAPAPGAGKPPVAPSGPVLRVTAPAAGRAVVVLRRGGRVRARLVRRVRAGAVRIDLGPVARRLPPGRYRAEVRLPGGRVRRAVVVLPPRR